MSHAEDHKTAGQRRLEYASSGRAKCVGRRPCKGTKIEKGELRLGILIDYGNGNTGFLWRHWGCVKPTAMKYMKRLLEKADEIDGFEELCPEDQEKVRKAWAEGKVADEDIPESAKKHTDEEQADECDKSEDKPKEKEGQPKSFTAAATWSGVRTVNPNNQLWNDSLSSMFSESSSSVKAESTVGGSSASARPAGSLQSSAHQSTEFSISDSDKLFCGASTGDPVASHDQVKPSIAPKVPSWHCRSCLKDPCDRPTATTCGHVFCHSCIMKHLATNMQCPVCRNVILLRLHVGSDEYETSQSSTGK